MNSVCPPANSLPFQQRFFFLLFCWLLNIFFHKLLAGLVVGQTSVTYSRKPTVKMCQMPAKYLEAFKGEKSSLKVAIKRFLAVSGWLLYLFFFCNNIRRECKNQFNCNIFSHFFSESHRHDGLALVVYLVAIENLHTFQFYGRNI